MEQDELKAMQEQINSLEDRVRRLENILNGSTNKKPGRKEKLTLEQKNQIIYKHSLGVSYSVLTKEYNVSKGTISKICKGHDDNNIIRIQPKPI